MNAPHVFRFDRDNHEYIDSATGEVLPHITEMLARTGWIDDNWYTEESSDRGQAVHQLTASYDLRALHIESCQSPFRDYLLAHVKAMSILQPQMVAVEEPLVHPVLRFGGRPDRIVIVRGMRGIIEIKSGQKERSHQIQTALHAILDSYESGIPPEALVRWALYLKERTKRGQIKFKLQPHEDRADFDEAYRVIRDCTRAVA